MTKRNCFLFIFAFISPILSACENLQNINWLLGDWQIVTEKRATFESWKQVDFNHYAGVGVQLSLPVSEKKRSPFLEFLSIAVLGDELFYIAKPQQNSLPIAFKATACSKSHVRFENTNHDFPQSITYTKVTDSELTVEVSSESNAGFKLRFKADEKASGAEVVDLVKKYSQAFNQRSIQAMMNYVAEDVIWFNVDKSGTALIETQGKKALTNAMNDYFKSERLTVSTLDNLQAFGRFVIATEKASWGKSAQEKSQCSKVIYQFSQENIANVWYYQSKTCENMLIAN